MPSLPTSMKVIDHGAGGSVEVMSVKQVPLPQVAAGELLIRVAYAGVNRPDVAQRAGHYPAPPGASPYMGLEVSGTVVALGEGVSSFAVGDAVCALCNGGGYAEYVSVPAGQVLSIPRGLNMLQAAALPETYFTVWSNVFERGSLRAGESLLIHGGSSGIGVTAIQLAKALGSTVWCTVGAEDKQRACEALGADATINYRNEDFVDRVAAFSGGKGVDVVLDMVGGSYVARNLKALALEGRLVQIAFLEASKMELDLRPLMMKRLSITGSTLRARNNEQKARLAAAVKQQVWPLLEKGKALPQIFKVFDLSEVAQAHALMESSTHIGKIMMKVSG